MTTLATLFPEVQTLLALEPEDLGGVLLELWDQSGDRGMCTLQSFTSPLWNQGSSQSYRPTAQRQVTLAVGEAMAWLQREGLIMRDPGQPSPTVWFIRTRRGQQITSRADVEAYRQSSLLPRALLHPAIEEKAWPLFLRGDYDTAVFQAFKNVEVAVRAAAELPDDLIGINLMRKAFHPETGKLSDMTVVPG